MAADHWRQIIDNSPAIAAGVGISVAHSSLDQQSFTSEARNPR
jgi:hypothetical protein